MMEMRERMENGKPKLYWASVEAQREEPGMENTGIYTCPDCGREYDMESWRECPTCSDDCPGEIQRRADCYPDLLAALEGVMIWVGCSPRKDQMADYSEARGAALSAIARAKGGQS